MGCGGGAAKRSKKVPGSRFRGPGAEASLAPGTWPLTKTMKLLTRENLLAALLCLLAVLLLIVATDSAPQWIYQGF